MTAYRKRRTKRGAEWDSRFDARQLVVFGLIVVGFATLAFLASLGGGGSKTKPRASGSRVESYRIYGRPSAVAVGGRRVYIADDESSTVHVLDASSGREVGAPVHVQLNPVALAVGGSAVWVAHANGSVTRIDPASRKVRVMRAGRSITDIAYAHGALWACDLGASELLRIDPRHMRVVQHVKGARAVRVATSEDRVWTTTQDDFLAAFNYNGVRVGGVRVGAGPIGLAVDRDNVWVANSDDGTVTQVDARTAKTVGRPFRVGHGPVAIAVTNGIVWVSNQDDRTVTEIGSLAGRVVGPAVPVGSSIRDAATAGQYVWLVGVDPSRAVRIRE